MSLPIRHLPVLQNWDCHSCGQCCREYHVHLTEEERQRIISQGWETDPALAGTPPIVSEGWLRRRYRLNQRPDGSCVFLSDEGRCRIHEKFGGPAKPFACQLFPFILVPVGDHWRVSLRYFCPSAVQNQGRKLSEHGTDLQGHAAHVEKLVHIGERRLTPAPLQSRQVVDWPDLFRFQGCLLALLKNRQDRVEHRWRKCLALASVCRQARFDQVQGQRLEEFLDLLRTNVDAETPADPATLWPPTWVGRILFRLMAPLHARKDVGPNRGVAARGRLALFRAAWRYAWGSGPVPRVHAAMQDTTLEHMEEFTGPLPEAAEELLERYYLVKVQSLQFCGPCNFDMPFWTGLEALAFTLPAILWLSRAFTDLTREQAVMRALRIIDNNFTYNPNLASIRQRWGLRILARRGELEKLIAWYSR